MAARLNSAPEGIMTSSPTTHSVSRAPRPTRARFHNIDRSTVAPLSTSRGEPTGAVLGVLNMLNKLLK